MWENTDQKNSEYEQILRSDVDSDIFLLIGIIG